MRCIGLARVFVRCVENCDQCPQCDHSMPSVFKKCIVVGNALAIRYRSPGGGRSLFLNFVLPIHARFPTVCCSG